MAAVIVAMVVCAGVSVGAASGLARYAQRNWKNQGARASVSSES